MQNYNKLNKIIKELKTEKDGYCRINHKMGWWGFLEDGDLVFKPVELHEILRQVIKESPPRGDKLFYLRKVNNFFVKGGKAYRTEEALERFITTSNSKDFFDQIPIGGKRESIDIGIEKNKTEYIFVELKPWTSQNSPLYAIVESLKNLIEYRIIHEERIKHLEDCKHYGHVDLIILAPESYYQFYGLIDKRTGRFRENKIKYLKKVLNDFSAEFSTNISFMFLNISREYFDIQCKKLKSNEKNIAELSEKDSIPELAKDNWKLLVSSDKK